MTSETDSPDALEMIKATICWIEHEITKIKLLINLDPKCRNKHIPTLKQLVKKLELEQENYEKFSGNQYN